MSVVTEMLTLLTLLAALERGAGAGRPPTISASIAAGIGSFRSLNGHQLILVHSEPVTFLCEGADAAALVIHHGDERLETEEINSTTIKFWMRKPNLAPSTYSCAYRADTSREDSVTVIVRPAMSLSSPRARWTLDTSDGRRVYFVPRGDDYEVFCSGYEGASLYIESSSDPLETYRKSQSVNRTTVKHTARENRVREVNYWCVNEYIMSPQMTVVSDDLPEATYFRCISYQRRQLECTWHSTSRRSWFRLFLKHVEDKKWLAPRVLCSDSPGESSRACSWNNIGGYDHKIFYIYTGNFTLLLQSCNEIFCDNRTFNFNLESITKQDPPGEAKLLHTSPRGAALAWSLPNEPYDDSEYEYRLEYRLLGTGWRQVNSSSVRCSSTGYRGYTCESRLDLPCSDKHYEVRVYVRLKAATEERYWSEPASVFFYTDARSADDEASLECNAEFNEREPPPSAAVVLYKVRLLISYERKQNSALKKKIKALKLKRARVKALMESITASDAGVQAGGSPT